MYNSIKERVLRANQQLSEHGLVKFTWGNSSEIDRNKNIIAIKPSGVPYDSLKIDDIVILDLNGNIIEGALRPSVDFSTHCELYKKYSSIGGITHTHSTYATAFAQSGKSIKPLGTTHADYFFGEIQCARALTSDELANNYEQNTAKVIMEKLSIGNIMATPGILVKSHGVFTWGTSAGDSVHNAVVLEEIAKMAHLTLLLAPKILEIDQVLQKVHYERKHGLNARYGQEVKNEKN